MLLHHVLVLKCSLAAFAADVSADNSNGVKTLLLNGVATLFINGGLTVINGLEKLRNLPFYT